MPCDTKPRTPTQRENQERALARLAGSLNAGTVSAVIGPQGALSFRGWVDPERDGMTDLCAYRRLMATNSPELRRAIARAEGMAGRKLDARAVNAGVHSHDGGHTWGRH